MDTKKLAIIAMLVAACGLAATAAAKPGKPRVSGTVKASYEVLTQLGSPDRLDVRVEARHQTGDHFRSCISNRVGKVTAFPSDGPPVVGEDRTSGVFDVELVDVAAAGATIEMVRVKIGKRETKKVVCKAIKGEAKLDG